MHRRNKVDRALRRSMLNNGPESFRGENKHRATERAIHHNIPSEKGIAVRATFQ